MAIPFGKSGISSFAGSGSASSQFATHTVENQIPPPSGYNAYLTDPALREAVKQAGGAWGDGALIEYGQVVAGELLELGFQADAHRPVLRAFDANGHRIDEVEFHPAYHRILELAMAHGVHALDWDMADKPGAYVVRAALVYLHNQAEQGTSCPLTMTHACVPTLRHSAPLSSEWLPRITSLEYDRRFLPATQKRGCMIGMAMTEKQGGSDVRANSTSAFPAGSGAYELVGHKWFVSAPMCDAFLALARAPRGLSCFLLPRWRPDETRNAFRIQCLKNKVGNWSNATAEVELEGAHALLVGEEGRGIANILEMVALTRLDCVLGSAGTMRQALVQAIHHARHRRAFGKLLCRHPLMQNVLADLALESEAACVLALRLARAVDAAPRDPAEAAFARVATPVAKYWVCKRTPAMVNEAQECLGGAGYIEESILPRLYREAPVNSLWEGCGNIQCLDVVRALTQESGTTAALFGELNAAKGGHAALDAEIASLKRDLTHLEGIEIRLRQLTERLAVALQASLLVRAGNAGISDTFCESRLAGRRETTFGTLPATAPFRAIVERAWTG